jgi:hypothetical protein
MPSWTRMICRTASGRFFPVNTGVSALPAKSDRDGLVASNDEPVIEKATKELPTIDLASVPPHRNAEFFNRFELPLVLVGGFVPAAALWSVLDRALLAGAFVESSVALAASIMIA